MLKIYNSLTKCKQTFVPLIANKVKLYVCGMTVYDYCHLGHARVMVVFDMVVRWFKATGYEVIYVRNITDVDDKIIQRAQENNESIESLTERFICAMNEDSTALGVLQPTFEPRATQYIENMVSMIQVLIDKGFAYIGSNGDVYYAVDKFPDYGKLSGKVPDDLYAGERVSINSYKKNPLDFVLWKTAKSNEPYWEAPWGKGRPGWHIECSAMCRNYLDKHFDIHGGGQDLQFPHHENEIAQSEAAHDTTFVNYWMHNGFVRVDNEKMSKSLGNFFTVRDILANYQPEVVRFFILRAHYRSPLNYSDSHLEDAKNSLDRLYSALKGNIITIDYKIDWNNIYAKRFMHAMNDDFNTPIAIAILFDLANETNKTGIKQAADLLKALGAILGLLQQDPQQYLQYDMSSANSEYTSEQIDKLIQERIAARKVGDYTKADSIRKVLFNAGIVLEDSPHGTSWRRE
ncbi:MAG: cysteine--tRNA ligase [Nitrosomonadaceae bacterium]|nr:cysteine--tRNA ligase [Nitrosomonadaceae bacterium]|tara:strand:+ start:2513 stop:3892 length:1380 start_codon:yes stop_codon:yes gene_type:complete